MVDLCDNYDDWKRCITVKCGIPFAPEYIAKRISALRSSKDPMTQRFTKLYGDAYRVQVVEWFERAKEQVADSAAT